MQIAAAWTAIATLALVSLALAPPSAAAQAGERDDDPGPELYGDTVESDVAVLMSDGVTLVGDVMYPTDLETGAKAQGSFPVLLSQGPYSCNSATSNMITSGAAEVRFSVRRGYIFASFCARGSGRSGGEFDLWGARSRLDGVELVDWAAHRLPGSDGTVGLRGCSYMGLAAMFTAAALSEGSPVKAMAPSCSGGEIYREAAFAGGMPTETFEYFAAGLFALTQDHRPGLAGAQLAARVGGGGDEAYQRDFWQQRNPNEHAQKIVDNGIPTLLSVGWDDIFVRGALEMYAYLQNAELGRPSFLPMRPGQPASPRHQIVVGPGGHGTMIDPPTETLWFDTWLKGRRTRFASTSTPMHLHVAGRGWANAPSYPVAGSYTRYFLHEAGVLGSRPPREGGEDVVRYGQPHEPDARLAFTSEPLSEGAVLAGPISATVYAATTGTNLHVIATLEDVAPDGDVTEISSGSLVGSLRELDHERSWTDPSGVVVRPYGSFDDDAYLAPGQVTQLDIVMAPRAAVLEPGHALRLVLTTQVPAHACGALLGTNPCFPTVPQRRTLPGTYTVARSASHPSSVNLPLLPLDCLSADGGTGAQPASLGGASAAREVLAACGIAPTP